MKRWQRLALLAATTLLISGCGGSNAAPEQTPAATTSAPATGAPSQGYDKEPLPSY